MVGTAEEVTPGLGRSGSLGSARAGQALCLTARSHPPGQPAQPNIPPNNERSAILHPPSHTSGGKRNTPPEFCTACGYKAG